MIRKFIIHSSSPAVILVKKKREVREAHKYMGEMRNSYTVLVGNS
jgi:hypothetical protein